jgi:RimJ/RimL family protein N-acetyltransferase
MPRTIATPAAAGQPEFRRARLARVAVLTTARLSLREMTDADLDDMAALPGDPEVMRHYPRPETRDEARAWIDWNKSNYAEHVPSQRVAEKIGLRPEKHSRVLGHDQVIYAAAL